eukprot:5595989-Pleurochrysis_carterae.AAC.2
MLDRAEPVRGFRVDDVQSRGQRALVRPPEPRTGGDDRQRARQCLHTRQPHHPLCLGDAGIYSVGAPEAGVGGDPRLVVVLHP